MGDFDVKGTQGIREEGGQGVGEGVFVVEAQTDNVDSDTLAPSVTHPHPHTHLKPHPPPQTHAPTHTYTHAYTVSMSNPRAPAPAPTPAPSHAPTHTHTHTHTRTHTHTAHANPRAPVVPGAAWDSLTAHTHTQQNTSSLCDGGVACTTEDSHNAEFMSISDGSGS